MSPPENAKRSNEEWDAEIEAEFQRVSKGGGGPKKGKQPGGPSRAAKGWQREYTIVPRAWEVALLDVTSAGTYKLATELLYQRWYLDQKAATRDHPIAVTNNLALSLHLPPSSKVRAIQELEQLGLIKAERGDGRSPRVTLLKLSKV
ncbi:hypothetical protein [Bradyrhizobium sp. F1.13.3]|uniref:hypothetical protein n=1 Tax=Bradyrhizobium sp. F1.13.3 TaxID=3156351 RepID=UPI00339B504D